MFLYAWLLLGVISDFWCRKIWNWMVVLGSAGALINHGLQMESVLGFLVALGVLIPFYSLRWMGAGDVKFGAVLGLWFGLSPNLLYVWLGGSLLAGLHGFAVIGWRAARGNPNFQALMALLGISLRLNSIKVPESSVNIEEKNHSQRIQRTIPYAGYLALAALYLVWEKGPPII